MGGSGGRPREARGWRRGLLGAAVPVAAGAAHTVLLQDDGKAVRCRKRSVGSLTYGWQSPDHPDIEGKTLAAVRRFLRSKHGKHIIGLFWDFGSLHQKPRTKEEDAQFKVALGCMANIYASALGTTVMRHKAIPPRPAEYDGDIVVLGGLDLKVVIESGVVGAQELAVACAVYVVHIRR